MLFPNVVRHFPLRRRTLLLLPLDVLRSFPSILHRINVQLQFPLLQCRVKQLAKKRHTPATPRPRTTTLTDLTGHPRLMYPYVVDYLPLRDMETVTQFIVRHGYQPGGGKGKKEAGN